VGFDELAAEIHADELAISANTNPASDVARRDRVERSLYLDVMVLVYLGISPQRHVERLVGRRAHARLLDLGIVLSRNAACGSMDSGASDIAAPTLGAATRIAQVSESLALKPALAHIRDVVLDARFVLRRANTR